MFTQLDQFAATPTDKHDKPKHRGGRVAALTVVTLETVALLTGCGQTVPDNQPVTTSQTGGNGTERDQSKEQNIAGDWMCTFDDVDAPMLYPFMISSNDSRTVDLRSHTNKGSFLAALNVSPNQISWTDTYTNPKGLVVTIDLKDGSIDGASGSYLNNFNGKTYKISDCAPYSLNPNS